MTSYGVLQAQNVLDWAKAQTRNGAFSVAPGCTGVPDTAAWYAGSLLVNVPGSAWTLYLFNTTTREAICNFTVSGEWNGWISIATATKPQEFNLPLTEEVLAPAKYCKTQFGMVWLYINVLKQDDGAFSSGEQIGTLPAGFRPLYTVYTPAVVCATGGGVREIGEIAIFNDGRVMFYCPTNATATNLIRGIAIFLASD